MTIIKTPKSEFVSGGLSFPNPSRSYDDTLHGVRFWGYDRTVEVSFFVQSVALSKIDRETKAGEAGALNTFDENIQRIRQVAGNVYSRRRRASYIFSYTLTDSDF